jgi:predicted phage baseplate assembly protein
MLPAPNLDDRKFQGLVDEAREYLRQRCPEWSDHNISDPGITLIETFAMMVEQLIYRLNRVPDRHYVKFLELLGLELAQPGAAEGDVTFWLSAPRPDTVTVPAGTEVSTNRTEFSDPIVFTTAEDLKIVPCSMKSGNIFTVPSDGISPTEQQNDPSGAGFDCFSPTPIAGDALWIGLAEAVPNCIVQLHFDCTVSGVGVDPDEAPYEWQAWAGARDGWVRCEVEKDETRALNRPGQIVIHVHSDHKADSPQPLTAMHRGWLRCVAVEPRDAQSKYDRSPHIKSITAATLGGTTKIAHARATYREVIGISDGTPGQRFKLQNKPVVWPGRDSVLEVTTADGDKVEWTGVKHFSDENDSSQCFHIDPVAGEVLFGPLVRGYDGTMKQYGAIPKKSATLRMSMYRTGGGAEGNVAKGQIRVLKSSVPFVARVENRHPATGGRPPETIDEIKVRAPLLLHARDRAVTARDFKQLAREASREIARAECLPANERNWGEVRVLVVPNLSGTDTDEVKYRDLKLPRRTLDRIADYLDERKLVGTTLKVETPRYRGLTITADVEALPGVDPEKVVDDVQHALHRLLHPLVGGPAGKGWPLGRPVRKHEVASIFPWIPGVDNTKEIRIKLFPALLDDPLSGRYTRSRNEVDELLIDPDELVFSYKHDAKVRSLDER